MSLGERREWASRVVGQLRDATDLERDEFVILAGARYREFITPHIAHYRIPLEGMPIGRQLKFLEEAAE